MRIAQKRPQRDEFSKPIQALRKKLNLSQPKFAAVVGVSVASVLRWENGHSRPIDVFQRKLRELGMVKAKEKQDERKTA
jgi:DNA-binding transcriptional regulator YiaG